MKLLLTTLGLLFSSLFSTGVHCREIKILSSPASVKAGVKKFIKSLNSHSRRSGYPPRWIKYGGFIFNTFQIRSCEELGEDPSNPREYISKFPHEIIFLDSELKEINRFKPDLISTGGGDEVNSYYVFHKENKNQNASFAIIPDMLKGISYPLKKIISTPKLDYSSYRSLRDFHYPKLLSGRSKSQRTITVETKLGKVFLKEKCDKVKNSCNLVIETSGSRERFSCKFKLSEERKISIHNIPSSIIKVNMVDINNDGEIDFLIENYCSGYHYANIDMIVSKRK